MCLILHVTVCHSADVIIYDFCTILAPVCEISQPLFNLKINEQSNVIVSPLASHIIVLKNIIDEKLKDKLGNKILINKACINSKKVKKNNIFFWNKRKKNRWQ